MAPGDRATAPVTEETGAPSTPGATFTTSPLFWMLVLLTLDLVMPFVPVPNLLTAVIGALALTVTYVYAVVQFSSVTTRLPVIPLVLGFIVGLALWFLLQTGLEQPVARSLAFLLYPIRNLALLSAAVCGGGLVARLIKFPNMLGPVCGIIALIDIWGVLFGGIVSQLLTNPVTREVSKKAMTEAPRLGAATGSLYSIPLPAIGVGDYLFLGLLFAVLHIHRMNWQGAIQWVVPFVSLALLLITFSGTSVLPFAVPMLPGLLFIGLGVAIPNREFFQYTREEKFALLYAGLFVVLLTGILYAGFTKMINEQDMQPKSTKTRSVEIRENGNPQVLRLNRSLSL